jgi:hypothetical protein
MKGITIIVLSVMLSGCTTKFAYKNLDWLTYWYVDDYIEFTDQQEDFFDQKLTIWLSWHHKQELPLYMSHLNEIASDINQQNINFERLGYHQQKFMDHWLRLKTKIVPDIVTIASFLSQQQVQQLFEKIDKKNDEQRKELAELMQKSSQQQEEGVLKKRTKNLKRWIGSITDEQQSLIKSHYGAFHANRELWISYSVRYQSAVKAVFELPDRGERFQAKLTKLLMFPDIFKGERLTQRSNENAIKFKIFLKDVETSLTNKQRKYFAKEIIDFSDDITDILN